MTSEVTSPQRYQFGDGVDGVDVRRVHNGEHERGHTLVVLRTKNGVLGVPDILYGRVG